jgi:hypothetical protein
MGRGGIEGCKDRSTHEGETREAEGTRGRESAEPAPSIGAQVGFDFSSRVSQARGRAGMDASLHLLELALLPPQRCEPSSCSYVALAVRDGECSRPDALAPCELVDARTGERLSFGLALALALVSPLDLQLVEHGEGGDQG